MSSSTKSMKKLWRRYVTKSSKAPNEYEVEWRPAPVSFNISMDAETREFYAACETLFKDITSQVKAKEVTKDDAEEYTAALRTYFGARTASKSCGAPYYCKENIRATIQEYIDTHSDELNASASLLSRCLSEDELQEEEDQAALKAEDLEILLSPDDSIIATMGRSNEKTLSPPVGSYFSPITPSSSAQKSRVSDLPITLTAFTATPQSYTIPDNWNIDETHQE